MNYEYKVKNAIFVYYGAKKEWKRSEEAWYL